MTEQQNDRALLKYNLSRYFDLFVAAIEDKEKTGDVERDIEFKAILQAIDGLSFDKFEQTSFRLTFSFYTFYINRSALPGEPEQRPNKVIHVIDSLSSRMACTLRTRTHLKVLGIEPPQDADAFRIYTVEAIKADARDQIAKYLSTIPIIKADPQKPGGTTANDPQDAGGRPQDKGVLTCPIPSGATVGDIDIVFLDDKTVRIIIQSQSAIYNFAQMGFMDMKTGNPNRLWRELTIYTGGNGITNQKDSERINNILQTFFKTEHRLLNRRQTFFKIRNQTTSRNKIPPQTKPRECPSCQEMHKHFCKECDEETEHCKECHNEKIHPKLNG